MPDIYFEDFVVGSTATYGKKTLLKDEMIAFAREFDSQPFHIDEEAAKTSFTGGLIASGWYVASLHMRMMCDDFLLNSSGMGAPGIEELKWLKPVRAGDTLTARRQVLASQASATRPDQGRVQLAFALQNQHGETVLEMTNWIMFGTRSKSGAGTVKSASRPKDTGAPASVALPSGRCIASLQSCDRFAPGDWFDLGNVTFTEADIIRFAKAFDNQPFHIDPVAAVTGPYGGIIASGWHTASAWMGRMAMARETLRKACAQLGERPAEIGPSPGFTNLKWLRPVRPGDVLTYRSEIVESRPSASRPGWGIVRHFNTGDDQFGRRVFEFSGSAFWEHRQT